MNCILLLLLLGCCGGFGNGQGRSGDNCGGYGNGQGRSGDGCGCGDNAAFYDGNFRTTFPSVGDGCGCANGVSETSDEGNCDRNYDGAQQRGGFSGNPSNWQDYPEISRRDDCGCENG